MTASTAIETVWNTAVWTNTDITDYTTQIYTYPLTQQSETEAAKYYYNQEINFVEALTNRAEFYQESAKILGRAITYQFTVTVNYFREITPNGAAYGHVRDFFETLADTVRDDLGRSWSNTIDFYKPQETGPDITSVRIDSRDCLRGTFRFLGTYSDTLT